MNEQELKEAVKRVKKDLKCYTDDSESGETLRSM